MSHEELQKKYERLVEKVRMMRGHQKEYFKYRGSDSLERARRLEREVDQLIDEEVRRQKSKQRDLF
ncbi:MAG: hypothetical protein ACTHLE_04305 [Agriterribacter sp.]